MNDGGGNALLFHTFAKVGVEVHGGKLPQMKKIKIIISLFFAPTFAILGLHLPFFDI